MISVINWFFLHTAWSVSLNCYISGLRGWPWAVLCVLTGENLDVMHRFHGSQKILMLPSPALSVNSFAKATLLTPSSPGFLSHTLVFCFLRIKLIIASWPFKVFSFWHLHQARVRSGGLNQWNAPGFAKTFLLLQGWLFSKSSF